MRTAIRRAFDPNMASSTQVIRWENCAQRCSITPWWPGRSERFRKGNSWRDDSAVRERGAA